MNSAEGLRKIQCGNLKKATERQPLVCRYLLDGFKLDSIYTWSLFRIGLNAQGSRVVLSSIV